MTDFTKLDALEEKAKKTFAELFDSLAEVNTLAEEIIELTEQKEEDDIFIP